MDGSNGGSSSPAPFLLKTYEMLDDHLTDSVVSWSRTGYSFVVWNPPEFARDLLPKYFKHNNFSSFIRQLNTYAFRKVDPDQWEFANEEFIRGQRHLLKNIHRRKPIHIRSGQGNTVPLSDSERDDFEKEIEKLRHEKVLLQSEIDRHEKEKQRYEYQHVSLGQALHAIDQRQQQLIVNLTHLFQKPEYASSFADELEPHSKKRRLLALQYLHDEASSGETLNKTIVDNSNTSTPALSNHELIEKLDSSLTFWEKFMQGISQTPPEVSHDFTAPLLPSPVIISERPSSPGVSDLNIPPCSPEGQMSVSPSRDSTSSPDHATSSTYTHNPSISSIHIDQDSRLRSSGIDMNMSPTKTSAIDVSENKYRGTVDSSLARAGDNDIFWQQFLTEIPDSRVQSDQRDMYNRTVLVGYSGLG